MIKPATMRDVTYIGCNLREQDRRELKASCALDSYSLMAALAFSASPGWAWVYWEKQPVAAFGVSPGHYATPHIWTGWAFGTDRFRRAVPEMTRFMLGKQEQIRQAGCRRLEVRSLCGYKSVDRWLLSMGAKHEGILYGFGTEGQPFNLWAWTVDD